MTADFEKQALGASVIDLTQQIIGLRARVFELQAELAQAKAPPAAAPEPAPIAAPIAAPIDASTAAPEATDGA